MKFTVQSSELKVMPYKLLLSSETKVIRDLADARSVAFKREKRERLCNFTLKGVTLNIAKFLLKVADNRGGVVVTENRAGWEEAACKCYEASNNEYKSRIAA